MKICAMMICLAALLAVGRAQAADWVKIRQGGYGVDICIDKSSIKKDAEGITHYDIELCGDVVAMPYAVDCSQDFSQPITVRQHWLPAGHIKDHWTDRVEAPDSGPFFDAKYACGK